MRWVIWGCVIGLPAYILSGVLQSTSLWHTLTGAPATPPIAGTRGHAVRVGGRPPGATVTATLTAGSAGATATATATVTGTAGRGTVGAAINAYAVAAYSASAAVAAAVATVTAHGRWSWCRLGQRRAYWKCAQRKDCSEHS